MVSRSSCSWRVTALATDRRHLLGIVAGSAVGPTALAVLVVIGHGRRRQDAGRAVRPQILADAAGPRGR
jgi:hypothetical protein